MGRSPCPYPHPGGYARVEECIASPANVPLERPRYPDPCAHRYLEGKLDITVGQARVGSDGLVCEREEAFYPLLCKIADVPSMDFRKTDPLSG
ncbi:MAG: hypothetical protein WHS82_02100 [Candidatus Methanosuratincola sp.]